MKNHPIFKGVQDEIIMFDKGFQVPSFIKQTTFHSSTHSNFRRKIRSIYEPLSFPVALRIYNKNNALHMDEVIRRVNAFFYANEPDVFKIPGTDYHFIGEFDGPIELDFRMNVINYVSLNFESSYPFKFYDTERTQTTGTTTKRVTINSKTQISTVPLIELTGLSGDDVQVKRSRLLPNGETESEGIRLSGNLPSNITIDIENERIYETNSGLNRINLLRIDSAFEDFRIQNNDVVVLTNSGANAQVKLTYKELLL